MVPPDVPRDFSRDLPLHPSQPGNVQGMENNLADYSYFPRESLLPATMPLSTGRVRPPYAGPDTNFSPTNGGGSPYEMAPVSYYSTNGGISPYDPPMDSHPTSYNRGWPQTNTRALTPYNNMAATTWSTENTQLSHSPPMVSQSTRQTLPPSAAAMSFPYQEDHSHEHHLEPPKRPSTQYASSISSCVDSPMESRYPRFPVPVPAIGVTPPTPGSNIGFTSPLRSAATSLDDNTIFLSGDRDGDQRSQSLPTEYLQVPTITYGRRARSQTVPHSRLSEPYDPLSTRTWPTIAQYREDVDADLEATLQRNRKRVINRLMNRISQRDWNRARGSVGIDGLRKGAEGRGFKIAVAILALVAIIVVVTLASVLGPKQKR